MFLIIKSCFGRPYQILKIKSYSICILQVMISYEKPNSGETLVYVSCSLILPESSKHGCFSSFHCSVSILTLCLSLCGDASHILTSSTVWKITQTVISIVGWDRSFLLSRGGFKLAIILPHLPGNYRIPVKKTGITCLPLCLVRFLEIYQEFQDPFSSYFACFYVFKTVSLPSGAGWTAQEENKVLGFDISWSCSSLKKWMKGRQRCLNEQRHLSLVLKMWLALQTPKGENRCQWVVLWRPHESMVYPHQCAHTHTQIETNFLRWVKQERFPGPR